VTATTEFASVKISELRQSFLTWTCAFLTTVSFADEVMEPVLDTTAAAQVSKRMRNQIKHVPKTNSLEDFVQIFSISSVLAMQMRGVDMAIEAPENPKSLRNENHVANLSRGAIV